MVRAHQAAPGEPPAWAAHLPAAVDHAAVDLLAERPRLVHYLDVLTRNALGKVQRHELGSR